MTTSITRSPEAIAAGLRTDDPDFRENLEFEVYDLFRRELPAARLPMEKNGDWLFTRYDDVRQIFLAHETFSNNVYRFADVRYIPQQIDPPEQREYRKILEPMFSPQNMSRLEPDIEKFAHELIDGMMAAKSFDFMDAFAVPFPTIIFCRLMGFPLEDHPKLLRWSRILLHGRATAFADEFGLTERDASGRPTDESVNRLFAQAQQDALAYLDGLIAARRREPQDDLLTQLLDVRYEGQRPLSHEEVRNMSYLFMIAGLDTVTAALGLITRTFAERPAERRKLVSIIGDKGAMDLAVEELLRFHASVDPHRRAAASCPFAGADLQEDQIIIAGVGSANRDETVFERPNEIILDRHPNPHLTFAVGVHRCLGIHLARRELRIALKAIHERMPNYHIAEGATPTIYTDGMRGIHTLPLVIED